MSVMDLQNMQISNSQSSDEEKEDQISKLPDKLIHHILSLCKNMRYAVKTSILSKRWRYVWTTLPTLYLPSYAFSYYQQKRFPNFIDNALILRDYKSDIDKFLLEWHHNYFETDTIGNHLNTWITAALNRNVVTVSVNISGRFHCDTRIAGHQFCSNLLNSGTLTKLELKLDIEIRKETKGAVVFSKEYYSKITFPQSMDLHCLRVLKLESLDICNVNNLFLRSNFPPLLEHLSMKGSRLSIDNCSDMLYIESPTLKYLELKKNCITPKKIKLNVPNLQTFLCEDYTWREWSMENISSLVCAQIEMLDFVNKRDENHYMKLHEHEKELCATRAMDFIKALDVVNELHLSLGILEIVSGIPDLLDSCPAYQLHNVRRLKVDTYHAKTCFQGMSYLMKILPNIESLSMEIQNQETAPLDYVWWYQDPCEDYEVAYAFPCMLSQLKSVEIEGLGGYDNEFKLVEFLLKNASNLKEVLLYKMYEHNSAYFTRMRRFCSQLLACPKASSDIAVLLLD